MMTEEQKRDYVLKLDEELLKGGVILSEWTTFLAKDAETAFYSEANLASILASQATIEAHLRYEYFNPTECRNWSFYELIENSNLTEELKESLHRIRKYRNKWSHVKEPTNDEDLLERPEYYADELEDMAKYGIKAMLEVLYLNQFI